MVSSIRGVRESSVKNIILVAIVLLAASVGLVRAKKSRSEKAESIGQLPPYIQEGFHRHDKAADPALGIESPTVGQWVMVQIALKNPQKCANYPGEMTDWLAMAGKVVDVLGPTRVKVDLTPTTDRYPKMMDGNWVGILELHRDMEFPWILTELRRHKS